MKLKLFFPIVLIALFTACSKKDDPAPDLVIDWVEETNSSSMSSTVSVNKWDFEYDDHGRVIQVGDRHFYYGSDGKVAHSRLRRSSPDQMGRTYEYFEKLSFTWDASGRLTQIVADSLHHRGTSGSGAALKVDYESLKQNILIAAYSYEGMASRPKVITYLRDFQLLDGGAEETSHVWYSANNVSTVRTSSRPATGTGIPLPVEAHTHYKYSEHKNHLYQAYAQLGFHPYNFGSVVSENQPTHIYSEAKPVGEPPSANPDWSQADQVSYEFNSQGQTVWMKRNPFRPYMQVTVTRIGYKDRR